MEELIIMIKIFTMAMKMKMKIIAPWKLLKNGGHLNHVSLLVSFALISLLVQDLGCICIFNCLVFVFAFVAVSILNIFAANLIWQNPIYLCGGELLVKDVDNVDDVGGLQHVGVVSKGPGGEDDQYYHSQFVIMSVCSTSHLNRQLNDYEEDNLRTALFM